MGCILGLWGGFCLLWLHATVVLVRNHFIHCIASRLWTIPEARRVDRTRKPPTPPHAAVLRLGLTGVNVRRGILACELLFYSSQSCHLLNTGIINPDFE